MKKFNKKFLFIISGLLLSIWIFAQGPPPPPSDPNLGGNQTPFGPGGGGPPAPPSDPNAGGNQLPGEPTGPTGAPIDPGTGIFLLLAAGYGLTKLPQKLYRKK